MIVVAVWFDWFVWVYCLGFAGFGLLMWIWCFDLLILFSDCNWTFLGFGVVYFFLGCWVGMLYSRLSWVFDRIVCCDTVVVGS